MSAAPRPARLAGADGLRGLAALGVVVLHVWMATGANEPAPTRWFDEAVGELRLGLVLFFVLSAHLLAGPFVRAALEGRPRPSLRRYATARVARIYPATLVALLGGFLVLHGTGHPREGSVATLAAAATFTQNQLWWAAGRIDPPVWSLGVEVGFYVALLAVGPLAVALGRRHGRAGVVALAGALVLVGLAWDAAAASGDWRGTTTTSLPTYLPVFACGIASAALCHGRPPGRRTALALRLAGAALVVADALWHATGTALAGHVVLDLPAAAGFALVLAGLSGTRLTVLDRRPLLALGTVSFGLYLWHLPVLYALQVHDRQPEGFAAALAVVLAISGSLATASWFAVERPVLRGLARRRARRRGAPAVGPPPVPARAADPGRRELDPAFA